MKNENNNLDHLKGKSPFTVPKGYMEGLTAQVMSQLPEKTHTVEAKQVSLMDRVRPWLYLAAVFAGLGLFFKAIAEFTPVDRQYMPDSLLVTTEAPQEAIVHIQDSFMEEDQEYLEYIERQYTDIWMSEELGKMD